MDMMDMLDMFWPGLAKVANARGIPPKTCSATLGFSALNMSIMSIMSIRLH